jgi:hypothetical protein
MSTRDWDYLFEQAAHWRVENMVNLGIYIADDLIGADLPAFVGELVCQNPKYSFLSEQIYARMFQGVGKQPGLIENALFYSRISTSLGESIKFTLRRLFTPTQEDWAAISLPLRLYYCYRLFRLVKKYL